MMLMLLFKDLSIFSNVRRLRATKWWMNSLKGQRKQRGRKLREYIYHNVTLTWLFKSTETTNGGGGGSNGGSNKKPAEKRHFELSFHKKHKTKSSTHTCPTCLLGQMPSKKNKKLRSFTAVACVHMMMT
ncbi:hypothetical protein L3X38_039334 [Prunus dulcis]|uniref:Uncharacterized protein n=1 Tax=Prunus dulcis TaxID=3755 RepID=A0AAD4YSB7_PRUDU|nr:hypothetical protein L3X38_039334 [Prunus dulcis]